MFANPMRRFSATDYARSFFLALELGDWLHAAGSILPSSKEVWRESVLASVISWARHRDEAVRGAAAGEGLVLWSHDGTSDPTMLDVYGDTAVRATGGVARLADLAALPLDTFTTWMLAVTHGSREQDPFVAPGRLARQVIGEVIEPAEAEVVARVLYRVVAEGFHYADPYHAEILRLREHEGDWRVELTTSNTDVGGHGFADVVPADALFG